MATPIDDLLASYPAAALPTSVVSLVARFEKDLDSYRSKDFKELPLRELFLNPLLKALGWDPSNAHAKSYADREVIQEASLKIGGVDKAPDYALLIDGQRKFFVEAKRPSVNIEGDRAPAYQIRRYCWSAGLPFGLVSDFEEFGIYDCRAIPNPADSSTVGRIAYFRYNDLATYWPILSGLFGRSAVVDGSLETLAASSKAPSNTRPIDSAFLDEIRTWRKDLAANIARQNSDLDVVDLNHVVQTLIDRLVFLRIAEARGLEAFESLREAADADRGVYARLCALFARADDRYNSGLFHGANDKHAASLVVGDRLLGSIVRRLYYPEPYEFGVLPADILGRIYEQFLGEVVTLQPGRKTSVEIKPEVRKAGGVYYTPSPIVEHIVRATLGPMLEGRSSAEVARLAVVDPACGSGSFLIAAFQYLIDWHRDYYAARPKLGKKFLEQGSDGERRLRTSERKRILTDNIYGVDIDPQAVEVAKLSLLLKVIEGQRQMELQIGRLLPDLDTNVVCGNSLIDHDYPMPFSLTHEEELQINPFSWADSFPKVFKRGGFDAVVGNPPYLNVDNVWGSKDPRLAYLKDHYSSVYSDKSDILFYFLKKAVDICPGEIGLIVSRSFLEADKAQRLRGWLAEHATVREVLDFRQAAVFPKVGINTAIIRITRSKSVKQAKFSRFRHIDLPPGYTADSLLETKNVASVSVATSRLGASSWNFGNAAVERLIAKMDAAGTPVGDILHIGEGMQTGANKSFGFEASSERIDQLAGLGLLYERARNSDIQRWEIRNSDVHLIYPENAASLSALPSDIRARLISHRGELEERAAFKRGNCEWWKFTWPLHREYFNRPRIFCPYRATANRFAVDSEAKFLGLTDTTVLYDDGQPEDLHYIAAILNSRLLSARFRFIGKLLGGGVLEYYENTVRRLPIPRRAAGDPDHDRLSALSKELHRLAAESASTLIPNELAKLAAEAASVEAKMEAAVLSLFGFGKSEAAPLYAELPEPVVTSPRG